jgi:hypothetical protein
MQYRQLGRSGVRVSAIGIGTNQFGGKVDQQGVKEIVAGAPRRRSAKRSRGAGTRLSWPPRASTPPARAPMTGARRATTW